MRQEQKVMSITLPNKFEPLAPWFARHRRECWLPVVEDGDGDPTASKFSGNPWLAADEAWPMCASCGGPMSLFLQLDMESVPDTAGGRLGRGLLQAFFCTESDCIHGPDEGDPFTKTHLLRMIDPTAHVVAARTPPTTGGEEYLVIAPRRIVGWERADDYPSMAEAEELGLTHQLDDRVVCTDPPFSVGAKLKEFFTMPWARDNEKLGGWPGWANVSTAYPDCPTCGHRMDLVIFQFGYQGYIPIMFGDGGQGHIVTCPEHRNILAYPWTCG
jgi:hypothetical protein